MLVDRLDGFWKVDCLCTGAYGGSYFIITSAVHDLIRAFGFFDVGVVFASELGTVSTVSSKFMVSSELKCTERVFAYKVHKKIERIRGLNLKSATGLGGTDNTSS